MKIKKIFNNNVVASLDENGREIIVMGKGIAYGLNMEDELDQDKVDKVFTLNKKETDRFMTLLEELPPICLELAEEIVKDAKEALGKKLNSSVYITLTDHINTMIERAKHHAYISNTMLWDIRRLYPDEFAVGRRAIEKVNQAIGSAYDDNEAASVALHFVNAELELDFNATMNLTKVITEILNIVKYYFRIVYNEDSLSYYRFVVHLRFFAQRLFSGTAYEDTDDPEFVQHISQKYKESAKCAELVKQYIFDAYQYALSDEEAMYLTIHIEKVVRDSEKL